MDLYDLTCVLTNEQLVHKAIKLDCEHFMCQECFLCTNINSKKCGFIAKNNSSNTKELNLIRSFMRNNLPRIFKEISTNTAKEIDKLESKLHVFLIINLQFP
jgi:hypothetical protein